MHDLGVVHFVCFLGPLVDADLARVVNGGLTTTGKIERLFSAIYDIYIYIKDLPLPTLKGR